SSKYRSRCETTPARRGPSITTRWRTLAVLISSRASSNDDSPEIRGTSVLMKALTILESTGAPLAGCWLADAQQRVAQWGWLHGNLLIPLLFQVRLRRRTAIRLRLSGARGAQLDALGDVARPFHDEGGAYLLAWTEVLDAVQGRLEPGFLGNHEPNHRAHVPHA